MLNEEQIKIPISKSKLILALFGSLVFVALGCWFLISPPKNNFLVIGFTIIFRVVGFISILFFGFCSVFIFIKIFDKKSGLIISSNGIIDHSNYLSVGFIPWTDISDIQIRKFSSQNFLLFFLNNQVSYITKIKNPLKRILLNANMKLYRTPICISSNSLNTNFNVLCNLLFEKMNLISQNKSNQNNN